MTQKNGQQNCLIIGGGLSGLVSAKILQSQGFVVKVLDKGRGIGGRLATRRINHSFSGEGIFDYGAQYVTAQSEVFREWVEDWLRLGIIERWDCDSRTEEDRKQPKYRGTKSIRSIAQYLASDLDVERQTKVINLQKPTQGWKVTTEQGATYDSDRVILTAPVPQSLELLQRSHVPLSEACWESLSLVSYRMCLTVLLLLSEPPFLENSGSRHLEGEPLEWIACNHQKGISPDGYGVTLHGTEAFSQGYAEKKDRDDQGIPALREAAKPYLGKGNIVDYQGHFWRYSTPLKQFPQPFFSFQESLYLAGDGFSHRSEPPVSALESAFLSGWEVARAIVSSS